MRLWDSSWEIVIFWNFFTSKVFASILMTSTLLLFLLFTEHLIKLQFLLPQTTWYISYFICWNVFIWCVCHSNMDWNSLLLKHTPSTDKQIKKMWYIYTTEYYLTTKNNETIPFAATWIDLGMITLSHMEKDKYHMISCICGI